MKDWLLSFLNNDSLARKYVHHVFARGTEEVKSHALTCEHVVGFAIVRSCSETKRPDTVRVTEPNKAESCNHGRACPAAPTPCVRPLQTCDTILDIDARLFGLLKLARKDVKQDFRVGESVAMAEADLIEVGLELAGVQKVAVVRETNAERSVDVKRLRLSRGRGCTGCSPRS